MAIIKFNCNNCKKMIENDNDIIISDCHYYCSNCCIFEYLFDIVDSKKISTYHNMINQLEEDEKIWFDEETKEWYWKGCGEPIWKV